jgi:predicted HTH transcriptional regulator
MSDNQPELFNITTGLAGTKYVPNVDRNVIIVAKKAHPTSQSAAIKAYPKSGSKRQKIYNAIKLFGGMTDEELERKLEMSGNTVRPSRVSLVRDELVKDSGRTRLTVAGNDAIVWVVC